MATTVSGRSDWSRWTNLLAVAGLSRTTVKHQERDTRRFPTPRERRKGIFVSGTTEWQILKAQQLLVLVTSTFLNELMSNGQRKAAEEAALIAQLKCCQIVVMLDLLIPQKCDLATLPNLLIGALLGNNASARHSIERSNEEALDDNSAQESFYWVLPVSLALRHELQESFPSTRSRLFVIKTFSFHMLSLRFKKCHCYRWLCIYKEYLRCVFNLGTKPGSVLPWSIHRLKRFSHISVSGIF